MNKTFLLSGPAGLFKNEDKHEFCWGLLEMCDENPRNCPIDEITFHSKGLYGRKASEILDGGKKLIQNVMWKYPMLGGMRYSNTEADPIKKWSEARPFQSDIRYAVTLSSTVLQHWKAIFEGDLADLKSISHDNSFLSYHPFEFDQRTLLARFQMNLTKPRSVQFVQKPVFAALGLLAGMGDVSSNMMEIEKLNLSFVVTKGPGKSFYSNIIVTSVVDNQDYEEKLHNFNMTIENIPIQADLYYFVEGIDAKTNPKKAYEYFSKPDYPNSTVFHAMRSVSNPRVFSNPQKVVNGKIDLEISLLSPYLFSIRICGKPKKSYKMRVGKVRLRKVDEENVIVYWRDDFRGNR